MAADACVANWAARLANAEGSISDVAEAAVGTCRIEIRMIGELPVRRGVVEYDDATRAQVYRQLAMSKVAQWRAGDCQPPAGAAEGGKR